jgi:hypothetical protein
VFARPQDHDHHVAVLGDHLDHCVIIIDLLDEPEEALARFY